MDIVSILIYLFSYIISMYLFSVVNNIRQKDIDKDGHSSFLFFSLKKSMFLSLFSFGTLPFLFIFIVMYKLYDSKKFLSFLDWTESSFEKVACKFEHRKDC